MTIPHHGTKYEKRKSLSSDEPITVYYTLLMCEMNLIVKDIQSNPFSSNLKGATGKVRPKRCSS